MGVYTSKKVRKEETGAFLFELQRIVNKVNKKNHLIITGDFNARVGDVPVTGIVGVFSERNMNYNGQELGP